MRNLDNEKTVWSVELEATLWADDTFNGTYEECFQYCRDNGYKIDGKEARLALLLLEEHDCCIETLDIVDDIDETDEDE